MKRILLLFTLLLCFDLYAQVKSKPKKYPSLFWEISGNGLKKPSYLFGTMHVSSKIAFHLSDSFYIAIRHADVVALETNPESWQEDMNNYDLGELNYMGRRYGGSGIFDSPADYLTQRSLRIGKYEKKLEIALFSRPSVINNLLYRSYSDYTSDFEEDTYLDMYIYQTGKRLGKRISGVEKYGESMRLMMEAYRDASKEKNKKEKSFDFDEEFSPDKLQEAYRTGNLDLLDSINKRNSQSDAFDEKFLYRRNEIQASSIDSILKKSSLFVGVGAAHLPGGRGVIELLRAKGYKLRPIFMGARDSKHKEEVEKIRVPVNFSTQNAEDGFFKVDIPGKFYRFGEGSIIDQQQYADMANGSFYMVTRVKTNSLFWGHNEKTVAGKIDSVLYENVPGKILSKTAITRNGYNGFDIINRTRRGDINRYHIFVTPFEVLFFRMGGNGDYVKNGEEAKKFFASIQLKELKNGGWKKFEPSYGGFSVDLPQEPVENFGSNVQYDAEEKTSGTHFSVLRTDIHNYGFAEEDTFDLRLMDESFASSGFIEKQVSSRQHIYKGYPALDCRYQHKDSSVSLARYIIRGPHYFTLLSHARKETPVMQQFLNSFEIKPFVYGEAKERKDTSMYFTVKTSWYPEEKKSKLALPEDYETPGDDEEETGFGYSEEDYKARLITNDTTGEKIFVYYARSPRYYYTPDSLHNDKKEMFFFGEDTAWIIRSRKETELPGKMKTMEMVVSDTGSSRAIWSKIFYKNGIGFGLITQTDTLAGPGSFVKSFFENFSPADTLKGINPYEKKSKLFFEDLSGNDSSLRKKAIASVQMVELDSADLGMMEKAIHSFKWSDKKYLDKKKMFISKLGSINTKECSGLLKTIYYAAGDTVQFQYAALEALLQHRTQHAYNTFRDIISTEPPVLDNNKGGGYTIYPPLSVLGGAKNYLSAPGYTNGNFMDELYDSLLLTKTVLPGLLPLVNLEDYKWPLMQLLKTLVDSNMITGKEYEMYAAKFLIEAKQELKKQAIDEKKSAIEKAEKDKEDTRVLNYFNRNDGDQGNANLSVYAGLLLPFEKSNPGVQPFINSLLGSNDKRLKYNTLHLLLYNKKPVPDTMISFFAKQDEYRYELFTDLKKLKTGRVLPEILNNKREIARSMVYAAAQYVKPDSVVFIDSLPAVYKKKEGFVYFFKYKLRKDDDNWKIATAGLISADKDGVTTIVDEETSAYSVMPGWSMSYSGNTAGVFTGLTDEKLNTEESQKEQLNNKLKKILYSRRKSAAMFYDDERGSEYGYQQMRIIED